MEDDIKMKENKDLKEFKKSKKYSKGKNSLEEMEKKIRPFIQPKIKPKKVVDKWSYDKDWDKLNSI